MPSDWRNESAIALSFNSFSITHLCFAIDAHHFFVVRCHFISFYFQQNRIFPLLWPFVLRLFTLYFTPMLVDTFVSFYRRSLLIFSHFLSASVVVSAPIPKTKQTHQMLYVYCLGHVCRSQSFSSVYHMSHHISHDMDEMSKSELNSNKCEIFTHNLFHRKQLQNDQYFRYTTSLGVRERALHFILSQICLENEISFDPTTFCFAISMLTPLFFTDRRRRRCPGCHFQEHRFYVLFTPSLSLSRCLSFSVRSYLVFSFPIRKHSSFALFCVSVSRFGGDDGRNESSA